MSERKHDPYAFKSAAHHARRRRKVPMKVAIGSCACGMDVMQRIPDDEVINYITCPSCQNTVTSLVEHEGELHPAA